MFYKQKGGTAKFSLPGKPLLQKVSACDRALQFHGLDGHAHGGRGLRCDHGCARAPLHHGNVRENVHVRVHGCGCVSARACGLHHHAGVHGCVHGYARENAGACAHVLPPYRHLPSLSLGALHRLVGIAC